MLSSPKFLQMCAVWLYVRRCMGYPLLGPLLKVNIVSNDIHCRRCYHTRTVSYHSRHIEQIHTISGLFSMTPGKQTAFQMLGFRGLPIAASPSWWLSGGSPS